MTETPCSPPSRDAALGGWVAKGKTPQSWAAVLGGDGAMRCNRSVIEGWAAVRRTMHLQATAFGGDAAVG